MWAELERALDEGIGQGLFSGAAVAVRTATDEIYVTERGMAERVPRPRPVGRDQPWDLASLTKVLGDRLAIRIPAMRADLEPYREKLAPLDMAAIGAVIGDPAPWLELLRPPGLLLLSEEAQRRRLIAILGAHLTLLLIREGWKITDLPGEPIAATRGEEQICPYKEVARLAEDPAARAAWPARAGAWGISQG